MPVSNQFVQNSKNPVYNNYIKFHLDQGEQLHAEPGAFVAGRNFKLEKSEISGSWYNVFSRAFFGVKSLFSNVFTGQKGGGEIILAPDRIGQITSYTLKSPTDKINLVAKSYLASTPNVKFETQFEGMFNLKGTGLAVIQASLNEGKEGKVYFHSHGDIVPLAVKEGEPVTVDNNHIIAYTEDLNCSYEMLGSGFKTWFGSGEGYVCKFFGNGTVFTRSHTAPPLIDNSPAEQFVRR